MEPTHPTGATEPHDTKRIDTEIDSYPSHTDQIDADALYEALSSRRRRQVIRALDDGPRDIGALARALAAVENDIAPDAVDHDQRKRVFVALHQSHLPRLDDWDIVDWDTAGEVAPGPTHEPAREAMAAVSEPLDEPDTLLDRVVNYLRGGA